MATDMATDMAPTAWRLQGEATSWHPIGELVTLRAPWVGTLLRHATVTTAPIVCLTCGAEIPMGALYFMIAGDPQQFGISSEPTESVRLMVAALTSEDAQESWCFRCATKAAIVVQ